MQFLKRNVLIFAMALVTQVAQADLGTNWPAIITPLIDSHVTQIGNVSITQLQSDLSTIEWTEGAPNLEEGGSRQSATFTCGDARVKISPQLVPPEVLPHLEVHEGMGRACIDDHDYALSTALQIIASLPDSPLRRELIKKYATTLFRRPLLLAKKKRGGTGVSGGGDGPSLAMKDTVLRQIMGDAQNSKSATADFLVEYPKINFEPLTRLNVVRVRYRLVAATGAESIGIDIPMQRWNADRAGLIRETTAKVVQLFPAYGAAKTRTFIPRECGPNGPTVTYPDGNDPEVDEIQDARAALRAGCSWLAHTKGLDSVEESSPRINPDDEPKESGNYWFDCRFTYEGRVVASQTIHRPKDNSPRPLLAMHCQLEADDYCDGSIVLGPKGNILFSFISYSPPGQSTNIDHAPFTKPKDPRHSFAQMDVKGQPLAFECLRKEAE